MKDEAFIELQRAESLLSNWRWLPGSEVKILISHLINALDFVASYVLNEPTILERAYLSVSSVRLFEDVKVEEYFYNTYYFLKNLLRRDIHRVNPQYVKIIGRKQVVTVDSDYFQCLINDVKRVLNEAFIT